MLCFSTAVSWPSWRLVQINAHPCCMYCMDMLHVLTKKGVPNMITPWRCKGSGDMNSPNLKCTSLKYTTAKRPSKFFCKTSCWFISLFRKYVRSIPLEHGTTTIKTYILQSTWIISRNKGKTFFLPNWGVQGRRQIHFSRVEGEIIIIRDPSFLANITVFFLENVREGFMPRYHCPSYWINHEILSF